jgi:DNA ligase-1
MKFTQLTKYFENLEKTSSRLALIEILSDLFKQTPKDEVAKITYLIQGRLAPFFVPLEIGMAEKTVAQSIANAYSSTREEVLKEFNKLGDMGKTAEHFSQKSKTKSSNITVEEVFKILEEIANTNGEVTVEKSQKLL